MVNIANFKVRMEVQFVLARKENFLFEDPHGIGKEQFDAIFVVQNISRILKIYKTCIKLQNGAYFTILYSV